MLGVKVYSRSPQEKALAMVESIVKELQATQKGDLIELKSGNVYAIISCGSTIGTFHTGKESYVSFELREFTRWVKRVVPSTCTAEYSALSKKFITQVVK